MFTIIKNNTNFDFMGTKYVWLGISSALILLSIILFFTKGLNYGIDFTGGIELQVKFNDPKINSETVRSIMETVASGDVQVQQFGDNVNNEYLIRVKGTEKNLTVISKDIETKLAEKFSKDQYEVRRVDVVGPKVGEELKLSGVYALIWSLLGIMVYVAIRFEFKYAPGAVISLIHDVIITVGFFALIQYQFTLSTVAALLTIIGYSINDTIVIYDRIRENAPKMKGTPFATIINRSVNETLSRTILTTAATLLAVVALLVLGGGSIRDFSLALTVGIVTGVYSTVFIASPMALFIDSWQEKKAAAKQQERK